MTEWNIVLYNKNLNELLVKWFECAKNDLQRPPLLKVYNDASCQTLVLRPVHAAKKENIVKEVETQRTLL